MRAGLTIPTTGIGVWEGAAYVTSSGRRLIVAEDSIRDGAIERHNGATHRIGDVRLDLTHRPTRLEVMSRMAERAGGGATIGARWFGSEAPVWMLSTDTRLRAWGVALGERATRTNVPALAALDPTDDTRLPGGARVVDVRALAIVAVHVFGGAS